MNFDFEDFCNYCIVLLVIMITFMSGMFFGELL